MAYIDVAKEILKTNIKAATFIDENAQEFTQDQKTLTGAREEEMSHHLYSKFRESGVSLEPIKYTLGKEKDSNWIEYCLDNRDLILLDWHLDGENGEVHSLKIMDKIINRPNIHFCVIYTSQENLDEVFKTILTNYSNLTHNMFYEYKEHTENYFGEKDKFNFSEFHRISLGRNNSEIKKEIGSLYKKYRNEIDGFKLDTSISDTACAIYKISTLNLIENAFFEELNHPLPCPNYIDNERYLIEINNTIIAIFNKDVVNPESLLEIFYNHIINDIDSYNHLLAIDFFNRVFRLEIINKDNTINFSKVALLEHRNKLKVEGLDSFYEEFINELLFEKMNLLLRDSKSELLSDDICSEIYNPEESVKNEDRRKMNVFYNSLVLNKEGGYINFGDVFKVEGEDKYLICLSPLCDCLRPQEKIKSNYFFAEGEHMSIDSALKHGDTAFISFLPSGKVVAWTDVPNEVSKYVPIYIKPVQYKVLEGKDKINEAGLIELYYLNKEGIAKIKIVKYITTIRQNYAQRIANHAFAYPLRVGVDFVKL